MISKIETTKYKNIYPLKLIFPTSLYTVIPENVFRTEQTFKGNHLGKCTGKDHPLKMPTTVIRLDQSVPLHTMDSLQRTQTQTWPDSPISYYLNELSDSV